MRVVGDLGVRWFVSSGFSMDVCIDCLSNWILEWSSQDMLMPFFAIIIELFMDGLFNIQASTDLFATNVV